MNYYLLKIEVIDGMHEYGDWFIIKAKNEDEASSSVPRHMCEFYGYDLENDDVWIVEDDREYLDTRERIMKLHSLKQISAEEVEVLKKHIWVCND